MHLKSTRSFIRRGTLSALLAALALGAPAVTQAATPALDTVGDAAFVFGKTYDTSVPGFTNGAIVLNGTQKTAYLQFDIPSLRTVDGAVEFPHTRFRRISKAELKLTLSSTTGMNGRKVVVWASDNYATGGTFTPAGTGDVELGTLTVDTASTVQTFDVTEYVTGEGRFSFYLKTDVATDISFYGSYGGTAAPKLTITSHDGEDKSSAVTYRAADYLAKGAKVRTRYAGQWELEHLGIIDVTKQPYGAVANDGLDDFLAIQRAVNDAQAARAVVYIPVGTFNLSDTLNCETPHIDETNPYCYRSTGDAGTDTTDDDEFISRQEFPTVIRGAGATSVLKLTTTSGAFGTASSYTYRRPLLYFWSRNMTGGAAASEQHTNVHASNFNHTLMNIKVDVSGGYSGAVAVCMPGSQGIRISEVTIDANGAYAGLGGLPGPGGIVHNVSIDGGRYGAYTQTNTTSESLGAYASFINYSKFTDQTEHAILYAGGGALTVVGCQLLNSKGIYLSPGIRPFNGNLNVIDSHISIASGAGTAITGTRNVYLKNVYVDGVNSAPGSQIVNVSADANAHVASLDYSSSRFSLVSEYAGAIHIDQSPFTPLDDPTPASDPTRVPIFKDANSNVAGDVCNDHGAYNWTLSVANTTTPALSQFSKHDWIPTPSFKSATTGSSPTMINVWADSYTANPNDLVDDRAEIQRAIDNAATAGHNNVFPPAGTYYISDTLVLKPKTRIFGINKAYTIIKPTWGSSFTTRKALIKTTSAAGDDPLIADLMLRTRCSSKTDTQAYQLEWMAPAGVVKDLLFDRRLVLGSQASQAFPMSIVRSTGGGKWYNFWINRDKATGNYRHMLIDGSTVGLSFYMFNPEYARSTPQVEVINAQNLNFYGMKGEGNYMNMKFTGSSKFRIYGMSGNSSPIPQWKYGNYDNNQSIIIQGCTDFIVTNQSYQQREPNLDGSYDGPAADSWTNFAGAKTNPDEYNRLIENNSSAARQTATPGTEQFVMFRRGNP